LLEIHRRIVIAVFWFCFLPCGLFSEMPLRYNQILHSTIYAKKSHKTITRIRTTPDRLMKCHKKRGFDTSIIEGFG